MVGALLPLVLGLVSTIVGLGVLQAIGQAIQLSVFSRNIVAGMGLALGIDYSLFMLSRYREERAHERPEVEAIEAMGRYASHAVVVSGTVVAVALTSMVLVPDRVLRSLALGAGIVTVIAVRGTSSIVAKWPSPTCCRRDASSSVISLTSTGSSKSANGGSLNAR